MKLKPLKLLSLVSLSVAIGWQPTNSHAAGPTTSVLEAANQAFNFACVDYQAVGMCLWLRCTLFGCNVESSIKVRHYIPDLVVQVYSDSKEMPLSDVDSIIPDAELEIGGETLRLRTGGVNTTPGSEHRNTSRKLRSADAFGNPLSAIFSNVFGGLGYVCSGGVSTPYEPYFMSSTDHVAWRLSIPEMAYPQSLNLFDNLRSSRTGTWGNLYPRNGYIQQSDDYKASAVIAQRVGDIVTRSGQPHVYKELTARRRAGYWPPGALNAGDKRTGKWQMLLPRNQNSCKTFPSDNSISSSDRSPYGSYVWNLWRPYACCQRAGQFFLTDIAWD